MNLLKPAAAALLASFLAACSLIPPAQQSSQRQVQAQVQTAADTGQKPPEKVTFPNMVKTTPLETNLPADKNDQLNAVLEQALAEKSAEEGFAVQSFNLPQIFVVRFMAQAKNLKQQVKIPENGEFKLLLEAGSGKKLEILDGDGSDGQATIRLPKQTYETLLHLQGPWKPNSSLEVSDDLYYVKDTLSSKQGKLLDLNRWFLLGVRPLPVPSDWYNPDGQKLVLKFKTDTVKEFQMAWWTTNQQAAYPPGIKQIGPAGGTVELPGVAQITIHPNALKMLKTIAIHQEEAVYAADSGFRPDGINPYPFEFISPVVKIDPLEEILDGAMEIRLTTDLQRLGNNSAGILKYMRSENALQANNRWDYITTAWPSRDKVYNYPTNLPGITNKFGYFARFIDATIKPEDSYISLPPKSEFKINSILNKIPCMVSTTPLNVEESQKIEDYCHKVFNHYVQLFDNVNAKNYPFLYFGADILGNNGFLEIQIKKDAIHPRTILHSFLPGNSTVIINLVSGADADSLYAEAITHELWHVFQNVNLLGGNFLSQAKVYGAKNAWLYEGSAQYMGASTMLEIPFNGNKIAKNYIESTKRGIGAVGSTPLYELTPDQGSFDYRGSAFFTYLSNPLTYHTYAEHHDEVIAKLAVNFSEEQPPDAVNQLALFIEKEFASASTKNLSDHFFKYSHFAISKERLALLPKDEIQIIELPEQLKTFFVLSSNSTEFNAKWIVGNNDFTPFQDTFKIKSLSAKYLRFTINKNNRSSRKFAIKVKAQSNTPSKFRFSALMYRDIDEAPGGQDFKDTKYDEKPDARLGDTALGIPLLGQQDNAFILTEEFNEKYETIYLVASAVDYLDQDFREFDLEISFQAVGTRSSSLDEVRTAIVEPKEPARIADSSGQYPDPLLWDQLPKLTIKKVPGCLEENCKMAFEHMAGGPDIIVKVPATRIIDEETDSDGVTLQKISAVIPNHAKPGGRVRVLSDDIEIEVFGVTPVSCNSIQRNSSYVISNTLQNKPNIPCGKTQAKDP